VRDNYSTSAGTNRSGDVWASCLELRATARGIGKSEATRRESDIVLMMAEGWMQGDVRSLGYASYGLENVGKVYEGDGQWIL
jgi:hypothetical protein